MEEITYSLKNELKEKEDSIDALTKELYTLQVYIYHTKDALDLIKEKVALTYQKVANDVALEKTEDGKKKFSNEDQRQFEIKKRLDADQQYQESQKIIEKENFEIGLKEIRLQYLNNKLTNQRLFYKEIKNV